MAASTIDRRLSTMCGYYRFAHIDGRIPSNPAQYVRRPKVQPSEGHGIGTAADMHDEWQAGDRRYLSETSMALLYPGAAISTRRRNLAGD